VAVLIPYGGDLAKGGKYARKAAIVANRAGDATHAADNIADAAKVAESVRAPNRTVIGKFDPATGNIRGIQPNENSLLKHLPDQGSPKLNWQQNSSVLRTEMGKGVPIRDAHVDSAGRLLPGTPDGISKFIDAECNLLRNHGWTYDPKKTLWSPPAVK